MIKSYVPDKGRSLEELENRTLREKLRNQKICKSQDKRQLLCDRGPQI